jgi:hypothetical protein
MSIALMLFFALNTSGMAQQKDAPLKLTVKETLLAELPPGVDPKSVVVSPDGKRVAYVQAQDKQQVVMLDGVAGKPYAGIATETLQFSLDSKRLLYVASPSGKTRKVASAAMQTNRVHFYGMSPEGKVFVVVDGKENKEYEGIDVASLCFSPNSERIAYLGLQAGKWLAVIDGSEEGQEYDDIAPYSDAPTIHFSPDSRRVAYVGLRREADTSKLGYRFYWFVVMDRQKGKEYDMIGENSFRFSPDSKRSAYLAVRNNKEFVVRDETEGKEYDAVLAKSLCFSPDSKRTGYIVAQGKKFHPQFTVIEGEEGKEIFGIVALTFSPDSQRVAYMTYKRMPQEGVATEMAVIVDGKSGKEYQQLQRPVYFSLDSQRIAYVALPPARRSEGKKSVVVVDDKEGAVYKDILAPLVFSPDGTHIAYRARNRKLEAIVVVDGVEGTAYEDFPESCPLGFDSKQSLYTIARRGNRLYRVEIEIVVP